MDFRQAVKLVLDVAGVIQFPFRSQRGVPEDYLVIEKVLMADGTLFYRRSWRHLHPGQTPTDKLTSDTRIVSTSSGNRHHPDVDSAIDDLIASVFVKENRCLCGVGVIKRELARFDSEPELIELAMETYRNEFFDKDYPFAAAAPVVEGPVAEEAAPGAGVPS